MVVTIAEVLSAVFGMIGIVTLLIGVIYNRQNNRIKTVEEKASEIENNYKNEFKTVRKDITEMEIRVTGKINDSRVENGDKLDIIHSQIERLVTEHKLITNNKLCGGQA